MSSSLKPCSKDELAYAHDLDGKKALHLCFVEDRTYSRDEVLRALRKASYLEPQEAEELYEAVRVFLTEIKSAIVGLIGRFYGDEIPLDLPLPRVDDNRLSPGEFPGNYIVHEEPLLVLHVKPKIGWSAYEKMINEARTAAISLISETGVLEPFLGNLYYPFLSIPISYSLILIKLTEYILSSTQPKRISRVQLISNGEIGKPYIPGSLKYMLQGIPLGVFERTHVETHLYPFMLLAKFHYLAATLLELIEEYLAKLGSFNILSNMITSTVKILRSLHLDYLSMNPLSEAFQALRHTSVSDRELVAETRRAARINPHFETLADLYEMYCSNLGLVHVSIGEEHLFPIASSKVYELWVLTKIIDYLRSIRLVQRVEIRKHGDFFAEFKLGSLKLAYNEPLEGVFVRQLAGSYLRPDFIFEHNGNIVVYDAKYKRKLSVSDVVRLLAYIVEYAKPIEIENTKQLIGGFYKLSDKYQGVYTREQDMPMKIRILVNVLDPSQDDKAIEESIRNSLDPLLCLAK